jgi:methionyl-tRNA synthetase
LDSRTKPPDRHLITSSFPYATGVEFLGNLASSMLPADVHARFLRARGESVLFVCASGEHSRRRHRVQARIAEEFGLSFDVLGRRASRRSEEQTRYFAKRLEEEGFLAPRSMPGREGRDSRHLFLLQSKLAERLRAWLDEQDDWPPPARSVALQCLDRGLEDRSITRDRSSGVTVDRDGYEGKVFDSRFEAPIAYIGATREWADARGDPGAWRRWWRRSEEVRLVQFMARDEVSLHTVCFPCTLLGSGEAWKLVDFVKAFDRLRCDGDEFPTGNGHGIFIDQALELLPADCWRYYLLANAPEAGDASFSWEGLAAAVNEDLAATFDVFVDRSLTLAERYLTGAVHRPEDPGPVETELMCELNRRLAAYTERMEALEFREAIAELRAIWACGSAYLERKQPLAAVESEPDDAARTASFCLDLVFLFSRLAMPVIPFTAERVLDALGVSGSARRWPTAFRAGELRWSERFGGGGSVDHEARLGVLEAQAPGGDGREYRREEEQHRQR